MENENAIETKDESKPKTGTKSNSTSGTKSKSTSGAKTKSSTGGAKAKSTAGTKSKSATGATKAKSTAGTKSKSATGGTKSKSASKTATEAEVVTELEAETEAVATEAVTEAVTGNATETEAVTENATETEAVATESEPEKEPVEESVAEPKNEPVPESETTAAVEAKPASKAKSKFNLKTAIIAIASLIVIVAVILISTLVSCEGNGAKEYTVTFDTRGGSPVSSYKLEPGEKINRPSVTPKKEMFVFYDWFTDTTYTEKFTFGIKMPKNDITVYAGWIGEASVEIKLNANGGAFSDGETEYKLYGDVGATFAMPSVKPTKTGYAFGGWYTDSECTDSYTFTVYPVDNLTLYASWVKDASYAYVSYYGNGALISEVPVIKNSVLSEPNMFGSDIISTGWYTDEAMTNSYTFGAVSSDLSLYTTYYTDGLQIDNGVVTGYTGDSASVIVPNRYDGTTVAEIGEYAFYRSSELTSIISVSLPSTITVIGEGAFYDCQYLVGVGLTSNVMSIGDNAFYKNYRLKTVGDISAVTEIGEAAFMGCKVLSNIELPYALRSLGEYAFMDCAALTSMVIPSSIQTIPDYLFSGCTSLKEVDITSTRLYSIAAHSFENCKALTEVTIRSQTAATISDEKGISTFNGLNNVKIKVISATFDFYRSEYVDIDEGTLADKFEAI